MKYLCSVVILLAGILTSCSSEDYSVDVDPKTIDNNIPVIYINTSDGSSIVDKTTWKDATIEVRGIEQGQAYPSEIKVKGRGNSTFHYNKKPFNIDFSKKVEFLNMPKSKKWVFLANYRDHTLLRNDLTFYVGSLSENLEWTPQGKFVDLVFNGEYQGNYYVCEKINVNKQHVNIDEITIDDTADEDLTGGYLLQLDNYFDEINKFRTELFDVPVEIVSPEENVCNEKHINYIKDFIYTVEQLMVERNFSELYQNYIDLPSFIDYYIVQTLSGNNDFASPRSVYIYKKRNGKLYAGPLWDFDYSTYCHPEGNMFTESWWYKYLFEDEHFVRELKRRWAEFKPILESKVYTYLEQRSQEIFLSALANFSAYKYDYNTNYKNAYNTGYMMSVDNLKENLRKRIEFMDARIYEMQ